MPRTLTILIWASCTRIRRHIRTQPPTSPDTSPNTAIVIPTPGRTQIHIHNLSSPPRTFTRLEARLFFRFTAFLHPKQTLTLAWTRLIQTLTHATHLVNLRRHTIKAYPLPNLVRRPRSFTTKSHQVRMVITIVITITLGSIPVQTTYWLRVKTSTWTCSMTQETSLSSMGMALHGWSTCHPTLQVYSGNIHNILPNLLRQSSPLFTFHGMFYGTSTNLLAIGAIIVFKP